jgi:acetyl/propionyl-CoA carboxylase alpha subunit
MIAKLIVQGATREEALKRMQIALESFVVEGVKTTMPFLARVMQHPAFQAGAVHTKWLEQEGGDLLKDPA